MDDIERIRKAARDEFHRRHIASGEPEPTSTDRSAEFYDSAATTFCNGAVYGYLIGVARIAELEAHRDG